MRVRIRPRAAAPADLGADLLPASKSQTQRAMLIAAFAAGRSRLRGALRSDDTEVLAAALTTCGAECTWQGDDLLVVGRGAGPLRQPVELQFGENATAARMLLGVLALLGGEVRADGAPGLRARPFGALADALADLGIAVPHHLPIALRCPPAARAPRAVDAATTTQVASGLLCGIALRGFAEPLRVVRAAAFDYVLCTLWMLDRFGVASAVRADGGDLQVSMHGRLRDGADLGIPRDASSRAFAMALRALLGRGEPPPPVVDPQPDRLVDQDLVQLTAQGPVVLALGGRPDSVPALAIVAAHRAWPTTLTGLAALRHKESDRLAALVAGITALGVRCRADGDALHLHGPMRPGASPVALPAPPDHRIVMALALAGAVLPGGVELPHGEAVAKSWPGYWDWLARSAQVERCDG